MHPPKNEPIQMKPFSQLLSILVIIPENKEQTIQRWLNAGTISINAANNLAKKLKANIYFTPKPIK